jgi:uncharacterized membrane protein
VLRHGYKLGRNRHPWRYAAEGVLVISLLIAAMAPPRAADNMGANTSGATDAVPEPAARAASGSGLTVDATKSTAAIGYAQIQPVIANRCYGCHGQAMQMKNIRLDSAALLAQNAQAVYQQSVVLRAMPMNNATQITEEERALIKKWFEGGALVQ